MLPFASRCADHRDVPGHLGAYQLRVAPQRERQTGERTQRHERHRLPLLREQALERAHEIEDHAGGRQGRVPQPGLTVRLVCHHERPDQRPPRPHRQPGALRCPPQDFHRVAVGVLDHRVAVRDRDPPHVQLRRVEGEVDRQHVVDAGIGVDDDGNREEGRGTRGFVHGY